MDIFEKVLSRRVDNLHMAQVAELDELLKMQQADGSFSDLPICEKGGIDYRFPHCPRTEKLAVAWQKTGEKVYLEAALKAMRYWIDVDFQQSPNWFYESIQMPRTLVDSLICLRSEMTQEEQNAILKKIQAGYSDFRYIKDIGANIICTNGILLNTACLLRDEEMLQKAVARIEEELHCVNEYKKEDWRDDHWREYVCLPIAETVYEGVQKDYSFLEHGPLLQTGSYGKGFLTTIARVFHELSGTGLLSERAINFIIDFVLNHYQWTVLRDGELGLDHNVCGRSIVDIDVKGQPINKQNGFDILAVVEILLAQGTNHRKEELETLKTRLENKERTVHGVQYYPCGRYLVQQSTGFVSSVRMTSFSMVSAESVNRVGVESWNMGDGMQFNYVNGDEYNNVFCVYDWTKPPGTTRRDMHLPPLDWQQHISIAGSASHLCGGVSSQKSAVGAMHLKKRELYAKKAWFFFEGETVSLGTGINASKGKMVSTVLEQAQLNGDVIVDGVGVNEKTICEPKNWVGHNNLAYCFDENSKAVLTCQTQTKNVYDNCYMTQFTKPEPPVYNSREVFTLEINHGVNPENEKYAYSIVPWKTGETPKPKAKILVNLNEIQAVEMEDTAQAVIWNAGTFEWNGNIVSADAPCTIIIENDTLFVGRLSENRREVNVAWNKTSENIIVSPKDELGVVSCVSKDKNWN